MSSGLIPRWRIWETSVNKLRISVVGLGGTVQRAWLPILGISVDWMLQGVFPPPRGKAQRICDTWRISYVNSLKNLAQAYDAVFARSSTAAHHAVISELPNAGIHVCVDKPLAGSLHEAEQLIELAIRKEFTPMAEFDRQFAPPYQDLKTQLGSTASVHMDKHRTDSAGPHDLRFILLDGYLYMADIALRLTEGQAQLDNGTLLASEFGAILYAEHHFSVSQTQIATSIHHRVGSRRESVQTMTGGDLVDVADIREWREERGQDAIHKSVASWQTTLEQRGLAGCVCHSIEYVQDRTVPQMVGERALLAQRVVEKL